MTEKGLFRAFALATAVVAGGGISGCASNNNNIDYQIRNARGQTGRVIQDTGGYIGRNVGDKTADALGHTRTAEDCRVLRSSHQARLEAMRRDPKLTPDDIGRVQSMQQELEVSCNKEATGDQRSRQFWGRFGNSVGRIGGQIFNGTTGMR